MDPVPSPSMLVLQASAVMLQLPQHVWLCLYADGVRFPVKQRMGVDYSVTKRKEAESQSERDSRGR